MADNKKLTQLDNLVGSEVTPEFLNEMMIEGRISFPFKPTTTAAVSIPGDQSDDDGNIEQYIDGILNNEDQIKLLEDMRDDMLQGMKIPPANDDIADAAKKLGSEDGTITKKVFDTAEAILDPDIFIPNQIGVAPDIGALIGDSNITGDFVACSEVTQGIADNWEITGQDTGTNVEGDKHKVKNTVQKAKKKYDKKLWDMFVYIFRMLWWNEIWPRVVLFHIEMTEKLVAVPIDIPFLILRFFKKFTKKNFYKYGPVHRLLNKLKIFLLCSLPRAIFKDYDPRKEIKVFYNDKITPVVDMCSIAKPVKECLENDAHAPKSFNSNAEGDEDGWPKDQKKARDMQEGIRDTINRETSSTDATCAPMKFMELLKEEAVEGPGLPPNCVEAAKKVLDAVYEDAIKFGEYDGLDDSAIDQIKSTLDGSIKDAIKESKNG